MDEDSVTAALMRHVGALLEQSGIDVDYVDLREVRLPFFERKTAREVSQYRAIAPVIQEADGYVLGTPDYHGNPSGTLKNFMDYFWREFTGKLFGYVCASNEKGLSAMDALRVAVRQCYGWSLPYGVSAVSGVDVEIGGGIRSEALRTRLEMMALDMARYSEVLGTQRRKDLIASYPTFLGALRAASTLSQ
jgi:FMN reductase